jgi:tubulin beta
MCLSASSSNLPYSIIQLNVYFTEVEQADSPTKYVPRSVQVDLEAGVCNHVRDSLHISSVYKFLPYHVQPPHMHLVHVAKINLWFNFRSRQPDSNFAFSSHKKIRNGPLGKLFRPDTFVNGETGAGNNWAKGCEFGIVLPREMR